MGLARGAAQRHPCQRRRAGLVETEMGRRLVKGASGREDIHALTPVPHSGTCGTPEEVADVVRALVGDTGRYLTGIKITVDGGVSF